MTFLTTNLWTPSLPSCNCAEQRSPSASTTATTKLFDDNETKDAVLNCVTGEVVGMRPKHIDAVDVHQLSLSDDFELDQHRKAVFDNIFDKRGWGTNPSVSFSASGRAMATLYALFCRITNYSVYSLAMYRYCSKLSHMTCRTFVSLLTVNLRVSEADLKATQSQRSQFPPMKKSLTH